MRHSVRTYAMHDDSSSGQEARRRRLSKIYYERKFRERKERFIARAFFLASGEMRSHINLPVMRTLR